MLFEVIIKETLEKVVEVESECKDDALQQAHKDYDEEKIILYPEDIVSLDISLVNNN